MASAACSAFSGSDEPSRNADDGGTDAQLSDGSSGESTDAGSGKLKDGGVAEFCVPMANSRALMVANFDADSGSGDYLAAGVPQTLPKATNNAVPLILGRPYTTAPYALDLHSNGDAWSFSADSLPGSVCTITADFDLMLEAIPELSHDATIASIVARGLGSERCSISLLLTQNPTKLALEISCDSPNDSGTARTIRALTTGLPMTSTVDFQHVELILDLGHAAVTLKYGSGAAFTLPLGTNDFRLGAAAASATFGWQDSGDVATIRLDSVEVNLQ